ncbi:MAG: DMT family transporter [Candidatus Eisenbacteria bacterium]|nr:DMT family transporter [Candidatus Eisenbacteria bacterium]
MSTAAPLIRWADAPAPFLAAGRLSLAAAVLLPLALFGPGAHFETWRSRHYVRTVLAGLFLGAHFLFWITSLGLTSVASSVFLVTLHPVVTAFLGWIFNRDRVSGRLWIALAVAVAAALALVLPDLATGGAGGAAAGQRRALGDVLALLGGLAASGYFLMGRSVRRECSTTAYAGLTYAVAALTAWVAVALTGAQVTGLPGRSYLAVLLMGLGPQLLGHTTFNWALRRLPAAPVAVAITGEPVGASIFAWLGFGERPPLSLLVAGPLIALGIYLSASSSRPEEDTVG